MDSAGQMAILLAILVALLVGFFLFFWKRDKDRSHEVSDDSGRFDADPARRRQGPGH